MELHKRHSTTTVGAGTETTGLLSERHDTTRRFSAILKKPEREEEMLHGSSVSYQIRQLTSTEFRSKTMSMPIPASIVNQETLDIKLCYIILCYLYYAIR